jgi:hypothetical protein
MVREKVPEITIEGKEAVGKSETGAKVAPEGFHR